MEHDIANELATHGADAPVDLCAISVYSTTIAILLRVMCGVVCPPLTPAPDLVMAASCAPAPLSAADRPG